jgi:hypothetical protein
MSREQKLVDICFELVLTATSSVGRGDVPAGDWFKNKTNEQKAEWVADQLRICGFDTVPCGACWGLLV